MFSNTYIPGQFDPNWRLFDKFPVRGEQHHRSHFHRPGAEEISDPKLYISCHMIVNTVDLNQWT